MEGRDRGLKLFLYSNSLLIVMAAIWIGSWFAQSLTGWRVYNEQALEHSEATLGWLPYVGSAEFWESTLQNWQSEFLAVGSMVVLSIYLRQRGSPESKPVGRLGRLDGRRGVKGAPREAAPPPAIPTRPEPRLGR